MKKSALKIICMVSGILFALLSVIWVVSIVQVTKTVNAASIGIIGGAGGPTAIFLMQEVLRSPVVYITIVDFLVFAITGSMLIFRKNKE